MPDPTAPPPDFSQEEAERMILVGLTLPMAWQPSVSHLGFGRYVYEDDYSTLTPQPDGYQRTIDLSRLTGLTYLQCLTLEDMEVSNLAPLATLTRLTELLLGDTQVSDLTPLAALTEMQYLDLANTPVSDLTPLAALTKLRMLHLGNTKVRDLTPLAALTEMQYVSVAARTGVDLN
jgi:hypothetical protein